MSTANLSYSTQGLSADCSAVADGAHTDATPIETAALLERLQAFAAIPSVDLIDVQPTVTITVQGGGEFIVRNETGSLYLTQVPTAEHSAMQKSAEEIVQFLDDTFTPAAAEEVEEVVVTTSKGRSLANSPALLAGLLVVWAVIAFFVLREPGPEGVSIITDPARIDSLADQIDGRYGADQEDGDTVYVVQNGRFRIFEVTDTGVDAEPFDDVAFAFGQQGGQVVLVLENGAVIGRGPEGGLVFEDETYPAL